MNSTMQVLVIGGTGTLGRQIAKNAIDAGHKVRCMVRKPKAASFLQEWGCELTRGNLINKEDIKSRNLPNQTSGLVITKIENDSPLKGSIELNSIILEAQKKKIRSIDDLSEVVKKVLNSDQKTILLVIYNSQNQRRYIGVKLD